MLLALFPETLNGCVLFYFEHICIYMYICNVYTHAHTHAHSHTNLLCYKWVHRVPHAIMPVTSVIDIFSFLYFTFLNNCLICLFNLVFLKIWNELFVITYSDTTLISSSLYLE